MPDVTHASIEELHPIDFLEGFTFRRVGAELSVAAFGMSIIDMPPDTTAYPAHDHASEGPGNPPAVQLGQEEVYIALRGSGHVEIDGNRYPLDAAHVIRVGPTARRKILPGPDGLRQRAGERQFFSWPQLDLVSEFQWLVFHVRPLTAIVPDRAPLSIGSSEFDSRRQH